MTTNCNELKKQIILNDKDCLLKIRTYLKIVNNEKSKPDLFYNFGDESSLTFKQLESHLYNVHYNTIHDFLNTFSLTYQQRFEPQESIYRLFCDKKLIEIQYKGPYKKYSEQKNILNNIKISYENFGMGNISTTFNQESVLLTDEKLKDSGDVSDLTLVDTNKDILYITTSKNYKDYNGKGKKFDLTKINTVYNDKKLEYSKTFKKVETIVVVRNTLEVKKAMANMTFSSIDSRKLLENSYFVDWDDLNKAYRKFRDNSKNDYPLHVRYYNLLNSNIILEDKNNKPRFFNEWTFQDEYDCKNIYDETSYNRLVNKDGLQDILKRFTKSEIATYYNRYSNITLIHLDIKTSLDNYFKYIFGKNKIYDESLNISVKIFKDNIYNQISTFCLEKLNVIVLVDKDVDAEYTDHAEITNEITNLDCEILINLSETIIGYIEFLKVNSDKKYNFIIDINKSNLEELQSLYNINTIYKYYYEDNKLKTDF